MTPHFQIVEARLNHCGRMSRILRAAHREAVTAIGIGAHYELRARFEESYFRRAWLCDGRLIGLGGVAGSALSSQGEIWLALAEEAARHPREMLRQARRQIDEIMLLKRSLVTAILVADAASFRFARHLGFEIREDIETIFEAVAMEYRASALRKAA